MIFSILLALVGSRLQRVRENRKRNCRSSRYALCPQRNKGRMRALQAVEKLNAEGMGGINLPS
jgi:hypothetical protein